MEVDLFIERLNRFMDHKPQLRFWPATNCEHVASSIDGFQCTNAICHAPWNVNFHRFRIGISRITFEKITNERTYRSLELWIEVCMKFFKLVLFVQETKQHSFPIVYSYEKCLYLFLQFANIVRDFTGILL